MTILRRIDGECRARLMHAFQVHVRAERHVLDDYASYSAHVVKVDDFPADFDLLASLQMRKEALDKALGLAA